MIAVWGDLVPKDVSAFARSGGDIWPLPELSKTEKEALLNKYTDIIANIGLENSADSVWWYTWSSCRDRFYSRILADMEFLARFQSACDMGLPDRLVVLCTDPYLATALVSAARRNGVVTHVSGKDRLTWTWRRLEMKAAPIIHGCKVLAKAFIKKIRLGGTKISLEQAKQAPTKTLLVSWIKGKNLVESGPPADTIFGRLPELMANQNHSVVVFGDISDSLPPSPNGRPVSLDSPILTLGDYLSLRAMLFSVIHGFFSPVSAQKSLKSENPSLARLIQRDIYANRGTIVSCLLFESALTRLVKDLHPTQIIHSCENNPWERACSQVANTLIPKPEVTGYMHCAVILSHTKIIVTEKEKAVRPLPNRLVCTGPRARDIMIRFGGHSANEIESGCALRHGYLQGIRPRAMLNRPIQHILVVLEGLPTMPQFLKFIYDALDGELQFRTTIRPHPSYSFKSILDNAGLSVSQFRTLTVSSQKDIVEDFENADLVVYKGSTAGIEAAYLGIPVIHVEMQNLLTDDPLFEITSLKGVVQSPNEMVPAILRFSTMDHREFLSQHEALRNYVDGYLAMPTQECPSVFLPRNSRDGNR